MDCAPPLYFDPDLGVCNWPEFVDCQQPSTTEAAPSTTEEVVDTTTAEAVPSTTEEVVNTTTTEAAPSTTEEVVDTTTSEASETTTAVPVNTTSVQPNTSDDTHRFRRSVNKMMSDEASTEVDKTTTDAIETSEPVKTTTEVKTTEGFDAVCPEDIFLSFVPHPDCNKYYECAWGVPILMSCPPTLYFDPRFNICNYPDQVDCKMPSTTEAAPSTTEEVVDTTTEAAPSTTEEVVDTTTEAAPSTTEEVVDTTTANAVETTTVMLKGKMRNDTTTMATPTSLPPTTQTPTNATDGPTEISSTTTTTEPSTTSGVSVVCPPSEDGFPVFVPHPTDCTKYYECQKDWPILMECAPPLYFDPSISACNWPSQVDCQ